MLFIGKQEVCIFKGKFNFIGEYQIYENDNILLTNEILTIVPNNIYDEEDIKNLIENKIIFDSDSVGINLDFKLLININENSIIVLETHNLFNEADYRNKKKLYFVEDNKPNSTIIRFNATDVNIEIKNENREIIIPSEVQIVKITLNKETFDKISKKGLYIRGLGLSINKVFIYNNLSEY